jgi:hypothetical protein
MLVLLGFYLLIGLLLAATWTGSSAIRHFHGLAAFLIVTVAWPVIVFGLIIAVRHY